MASTDIKCVLAKTDVEVSKVRYTWTINNAQFRLKDYAALCSGTFTTSNEVCWQTRIHKVSNHGGGSSCLLFELECLGLANNTFLKCPAEFYYQLLLKSAVEIRLCQTSFQVFDNENRSITVFSSMKYDEILKSALPDDTLTFICNVVTKMNERLIHIDSAAKAVVALPPCHLLEDFAALLEDHRLSDVTLIVQGRELKAHKAILAIRSPVFSAMFNTDMAENQQNEVKITDMEFEVAQQMLRCIYTGKAEVNPELANHLLAAADKYALERLKTECEQIIGDTISVETAVQVLVLADRHNAIHLKTRAMHFIKTNADQVTEGDDFKAMVVGHPDLMIELYRVQVSK